MVLGGAVRKWLTADERNVLYGRIGIDRKSTRLNSSHVSNSYAVFCLKKKTDDVLVAAAAAGDEGAFEQLFERHRRQVARIGCRFFPQREQIEEIIQDSFTKAYFAFNTD